MRIEIGDRKRVIGTKSPDDQSAPTQTHTNTYTKANTQPHTQPHRQTHRQTHRKTQSGAPGLRLRSRRVRKTSAQKAPLIGRPSARHGLPRMMLRTSRIVALLYIDRCQSGNEGGTEKKFEKKGQIKSRNCARDKFNQNSKPNTTTRAMAIKKRCVPVRPSCPRHHHRLRCHRRCQIHRRRRRHRHQPRHRRRSRC